MIEFPEGRAIADQLNRAVINKKVSKVFPPTKPHKFCWFSCPANEYDKKLSGSIITRANSFGMYAELSFDNGLRLCFNDGVNVRLLDSPDVKSDYQLLVALDDCALCFTVAMYGSIILHDGNFDNDYYLKSKNALSPFDKSFSAYYYHALSESKPSLSVKAFIATQQRFPGIGNGVAQDIMFEAGLNPKRKLSTLSSEEKQRLLERIVSVLGDMTEKGGRDTEKDIFGNPGGYVTKMSKNAPSVCPICGGAIKKESYLGGSVYYCPHCQPLDPRPNDI